MKKLLISALAAVGIAAIAMPAFALEHQFGGYWRTRAYIQNDYQTGGDRDVTQVDTRTRLYYTAKFSDNFKFVNKFEFNTVWGDKGLDTDGDGEIDTPGGGGIGADGKNDWRIKNSYVDMTFCDWNVKVGIQSAVYARGFLFDDDFSGVTLTYNGNGFTVPIVWMKVVEGGMGDDFNDYDVDYLLVSPTFSVNENFEINPMFGWLRSKEDQYLYGGWDDLNVFIAGLNADFNFDNFSLWFTGMYQFGTIDRDPMIGQDLDVSAFLVAIGGEVDLGAFSIHGQTFYASGDDDLNDDDMEAFTVGRALGQSYYWSEIMGHNTFDNNASWGSPHEYPTNIWAINMGAKFKPTERWTLEGDLWYAMKAEDVATWDRTGEDDKLGFELDLAATYQIFDNMNIRFVAGYLFADDVTGDDDPWLLGTRLEFKF